MAERELEAEYQRVLEQSRASGDLLEESAGSERRQHPRIRVRPGDLPAELDPWVFAIDISISGMAFFAEEPVEPGKRVTIALGELQSAEVEVVGCREEAGTLHGDPKHYRLHCRFADEEAGMRMLVAIKELEQKAN